jgi:hypothetical protein
MRCDPAHHFTVAKARTWRSAVEEHPPYQRESAVWSLDKQQLFIDSLLNGYDVPKIYLHDLRGRHPTKVYAIVDGKQRLTTIWDYLADRFPLAAQFRIEPGNMPDVPPDAVTPAGALRFSELDPRWQKVLTGTYLSVVLIRDATEEDIEDLFSRLNNGEALNAAERRNALGGDMARLIREVARLPFFTERLHFSNARLQHLDLAARLLALEAARRAEAAGIPDLGPKALDTFVREHRRMADAERSALLAGVGRQLDVLARVFAPADPLLGSPAQALLHHLFVWSVLAGHGPDVDESAIRAFLDGFQRTRTAELDRPEEERDGALVEFSRLMQHGANEPRNIEQRLGILRGAYERSLQGAPGIAPERAGAPPGI